MFPRPLQIQRIILVFTGEQLTGRSTDPADMGSDKTTQPAYKPYTMETWVDPNNVTVYRCDDQREGMRHIHTFTRDQLATISNVWQQLFSFNNNFHIPIQDDEDR